MILHLPRGTPWTGSWSAISFAVTTLTPVHSAVTCTMMFTSIPTCGFVLISSVVSILILRLTSLVTLLVLDPISPFYLFFLCYQFQYFTSLLYDAYLHILSLCEIFTQKETVKWWSVPCWSFLNLTYFSSTIKINKQERNDSLLVPVHFLWYFNRYRYGPKSILCMHAHIYSFPCAWTHNVTFLYLSRNKNFRLSTNM